MQTDSYTKFVLTLVALCLILLVIQGFGRGARGPYASMGDEASMGRYRIALMAGNVVRIDTQSGEAWRMSLRADPPVWTHVAEPGSAEAAAAGSAAQPKSAADLGIEIGGP